MVIVASLQCKTTEAVFLFRKCYEQLFTVFSRFYGWHSRICLPLNQYTVKFQKAMTNTGVFLNTLFAGAGGQVLGRDWNKAILKHYKKRERKIEISNQEIDAPVITKHIILLNRRLPVRVSLCLDPNLPLNLWMCEIVINKKAGNTDVNSHMFVFTPKLSKNSPHKRQFDKVQTTIWILLMDKATPYSLPSVVHFSSRVLEKAHHVQLTCFLFPFFLR